MGRRDDQFVDDATSDAAFRELLGALGEPRTLAPPPDIVTRTTRVLTQSTPAPGAPARVLLLLSGAAGLLVFMLGLINVLASLHVLPPVALLLGDGSSGVSRALLALSLLLKPVLGVMLDVDPLALVSVAIAMSGGALLGLRLMRGTPVIVEVRP